MKYLKLYNLFEQSKVDSTQIAKWSDVKDIINVVEDELNFQFKELKIRELLKDSVNGVVYDVKGFLDRKDIDGRL